LLCKDKMKKIDLMKNFRSVKWTTEHTLSKEQFHRMIQEKTERAERLRTQSQIQERKQIYT